MLPPRKLRNQLREGLCPKLRLALSLLACSGCYSAGGADNPNTEYDNGVYGSAYYFTVSDALSGETLSSGCSGNPPGATVQAPLGSRLFYEVLEERVRNDDAVIDPDSSCNADGQPGNSPAYYVHDLACWELPEAPLRVESVEIVPARRRDDSITGGLVSGKGYRAWIEVVDFGSLRWERSESDCTVTVPYPFGLTVRE